MEHVISAPHAGTVAELDVTPGTTVAMDQVLAVVTLGTSRDGTEEEDGELTVTGTAHDRARRRPARPGSRIHEVGARDGLQNEAATVPDEVKAEFVAPARRRRADHHRGDQLRAPEVGAAAGRRRGAVARCCGDLPGRALPGARAERARPGPGARARARREIAIFASATETFAQAQPQPHGGRVAAMFGPVVARAGAAGVHVRGYLSMCFGDPWEGASRSSRSSASPRALLDLGCHELSLGDTIGVATPGHVTALLDALDRRRACRRPARPCTSTTPTARRWPTPWPRSSTASPPSTPPRAASAAARTPRAPPATSPPRTWCGCCDGLGIETGVDLDRLVATSVWMAEQLGRPSPSRTVRALAHQESPRSHDPDRPPLSAEHEELRRTVEEFAHDVVAPKIGDFYERHEFPYEIVREMGRMGLFGLPFPEEYGGMGGDYFALVPRPGGAGPGRLLGRDHPGGRRLARRDADLPVRHRGAEARVAAASCAPARCSARSA